jgi:hypothetical protein
MNEKGRDIYEAMELGKLIANAVGLEVDRVQRIIIDIQVNCPVRLFVEMIGDERLLSMDWGKGLTGAEIIRE